MVDSSSPGAVVPPIVGAVVLILGTGSAVFLNANKRRRQKILQQEQDSSKDEEVGDYEALPGTKKTDIENDPPLLLPTVSAATSDFGSLTYNIFVFTAVVHGACLVLTSLYQKDAADKANTSLGTTMGTLLLIGASVAAGGIILTSIIPARGRGTIPHISFGFVFIEAAIVWMVWTCVVTPTVGGSTGLLVVRIILTTLACTAMSLSINSTAKTMRLRGKEGVEDQWYQLMHRTAICQLSFGFSYAVFLGLVAIDF